MQDRRRTLAWWMLVLFVGLPAMGATVESIPKPPPGHWSVDTTGTLRAETLAELDRIGTQLNESGHGQLAVVMVDSTEGRQPRAYATELFNRWGIGNADRDDGALLLVAMEDRKIEIVLGDGVDSAEDIERSDAVMASIIPLFKRGDADSGMLEGARGLNTLLAQHPPSTSPTGMSLGGGFTVPNQLSSETPSRSSGEFSGVLAFIAAAVIAGIAALLLMDKNSRGPRKPRPPNTKKPYRTAPFWGGIGAGGFSGGGGFGGGGGGGGGFGGGSSSGGGSSGGF